MTSKLFVTLDDLKFRMTIDPELEGVDDALESAIIASQLRIEAFLDTKINKASYTTRFHLDKDAYSNNQPSGLFRCYLKCGFIDGTVPLVVTHGDTWNTATTPVPATDYYVDLDKGLLYIDAGSYSDQYISVGYTAGFTHSSEIPPWLNECIVSYAPVVLNFSEVVRKSDLNEGGYKTSGDHALAIASPYLRNVGFLIRPLF